MADTTRTTPGSPSTGGSIPGGSGERQGSQHQGAQHQGAQPDARDARHHGGEDSAGIMTEALTDAKKIGSELVGAVRDSAVSLLDQQRSRAADQIVAMGEAVRRSGQSFEGVGGEAVVRYADDAARQIVDFAETMRDRSWSELAGDVEDFARRMPIVYLAAAFGIGFLAGRFLLSSAERGIAQASARSGRTANPANRQYGAMGHQGGSHTTLPGSTRSGPGSAANRE